MEEHARENDVFRRLRADAARRKRESEARLHRIRRLRLVTVALAGAVLLVLAAAYLRVSRQNVEIAQARDDAEERRVEADLKRAEAEQAKEAQARSDAQLLREQAERLSAQEATEKAQKERLEAVEKANVAFVKEKEAEDRRKAAERKFEDAHRRIIEQGLLEDDSRWAFDADAARARQEQAARDLGRPARIGIPLAVGVRPLAFRLVAPTAADGFVMGSKPREIGRGADEYLHPVTLDAPYWMAETELTRGQWRALVPVEKEEVLGAEELPAFADLRGARRDWLWRTRPLPPEEADLPAAGVSWREVHDLLLPAPDGLRFRLPTEAEWEWACRAGSADRYALGHDPEDAPRFAWIVENAMGDPQPVARQAPNAWGLYDLHGNVGEFAEDFYSPLFYLEGPGRNPRNDEAPGERRLRVVRGGSFLDDADGVRSARRADIHERNRYDFVGVRPVLVPVR